MPVIASHQHRFIFLKTRKTAGTSVEIALSKVCGPDDIITEISPEDEKLRQAAGGRPPQNFESPPLERKAYNHMGAKAVRDRPESPLVLVGCLRCADYLESEFPERHCGGS